MILEIHDEMPARHWFVEGRRFEFEDHATAFARRLAMERDEPVLRVHICDHFGSPVKYADRYGGISMARDKR